MTRCVRCHRALTDPVSIQRAYGPVCFAKGGAIQLQLPESNEPTLPFDPHTKDIICLRDDGGYHTNLMQRVVYHSPDGFSWHYLGSGPSEFALNILDLFVPPGSDGQPPVTLVGGRRVAQGQHPVTVSVFAFEHYHQFKEAFIATLPEEGGVIPGDTIRAWIAQQQAEGATHATN